MNYKDTSDKLVKLLNLRGKPVAITLVKEGDKVPDGLIEIEDRIRWCQMVQRARLGDEIAYAAEEKHRCNGGASALGIVPQIEILSSGKYYYEKLNKERSLEIAKQAVANIPNLETGSVLATIAAPLDKTPTDPDAVIIICSPLGARRIVQSLVYLDGTRLSSSFSGIQSFCADAVVCPVLTGTINISLGCDGAAQYSGLKNDEVVAGVPGALLQDVVKVLEERAGMWDKMMHSPPQKAKK